MMIISKGSARLNIMNEQFRSIANDAGFVLWSDEDWKPENGIVDWSSNYDHELYKHSQLLVQECSNLIAGFVDQRIPASEYPALLKQHFGM